MQISSSHALESSAEIPKCPSIQSRGSLFSQPRSLHENLHFDFTDHMQCTHFAALDYQDSPVSWWARIQPHEAAKTSHLGRGSRRDFESNEFPARFCLKKCPHMFLRHTYYGIIREELVLFDSRKYFMPILTSTH
jgi:hypothetical protein